MGVWRAEFDSQVLTQGQLKLLCLNLRFQDGTQIDTEQMDALPPTLTLTGRQTKPQCCWPFLSFIRMTVIACNRKTLLNIRCVTAVWRDVRNQFDDDIKPMAVMQHELTLRLSTQDNANYLTCPVARILKDVQGNYVLDGTFIPPLLAMHGNHGLCDKTEVLLTQLRARIIRLMAMRRESNERMADFAVADVSLFWLLNALNTAEPVTGMYQRFPQVHPERVYQELARLAGALLTFSLEHEIGVIPLYQHDDLSNTFCRCSGC